MLWKYPLVTCETRWC